MLYEPSKTKRYIIIGAIAVVLAVLAIVVISLLNKKKATQIPPAAKSLSHEKAMRQKIQKEFESFFNSGNCRGRGLPYQSA